MSPRLRRRARSQSAGCLALGSRACALLLGGLASCSSGAGGAEDMPDRDAGTGAATPPAEPQADDDPSANDAPSADDDAPSTGDDEPGSDDDAPSANDLAPSADDHADVPASEPPATGGSAPGPSASGGCGATQTFEDGASPSREVFVEEGAASSGDGSSERPYATLDEALADATPGTAIRIRPGTYAGGAYASTLAGSADAPIWIGGVPGQARPVISGGDTAFQLSGASFVIVHELELTGQSANGINVDDGEVASGSSHDLVFRDLSIHDLGDGGNQDCLKLSGVDRFFVLGSEFRGCSGGSAIDHVGCHHGVIAHNLFSDLGGNGVQSKGGSDDLTITQNTFVNAGERAVHMGGSTGFEFFRPALSMSRPNFEARDIRVVANLFRGGVSPIAFVGCVDCLAANNTIVDPEHWVLRILQETTSSEGYEFTPARDGRFVNNLVYYAVADLSTHVNVGPDTASDTFVLAHNLWYAYDAPGASAPYYLPVAETDGIYGEDPGLASTEEPRIGPSSPAAGAGVELSEVVADWTGECYSAPPAIGAFEVQ